MWSILRASLRLTLHKRSRVINMSTLTCPIRSKCPSDKMFWNVLDGVCSLFQAGYRPASPQPAMRVWENPRTRPAPHLRLISASFLSLRVGQHRAMINLNNSRRQSYDQMRLAQGITEKLRQCLAMPELHGWVPWGVSWSNWCHRRAYETSGRPGFSRVHTWPWKVELAPFCLSAWNLF